MKINRNFLSIKQSYLFTDIAHKVSAYQNEYPEKDVIRMGIGDVTLPLCQAVTDAMQKAVSEMGVKETFHGYGPEQGYDFLKEAIAAYYQSHNVTLSLPEIFVSDGAKSDIGNILDLFAEDNVVLVPDPVYPVYVDTNVMAGRKVKYMNASAQNGFLPRPDEGEAADIIYLCSPNNPTGAAYSRDQLKQWVDYALSHNALILFDAAYEAFISDNSVPHSIFEIDGAKKCAIEFCSFSKTAGFTGTRCGYTVIPDECVFEEQQLNKFWLRRQTTKFNGVAYVVQRGAAAVFSKEGQAQVQKNIAYYKENARMLGNALKKMGISYTGGNNSPYIWMQCPNGMTSWDYFDFLLKKANIVGTPGAGFGQNGEGFFRLTAFNTHENTAEAVQRMQKL